MQAHLTTPPVCVLSEAFCHRANPAARDTTTVVLRQIGKAIRDDERLASAMLPTGDGLLVAVKK